MTKVFLPLNEVAQWGAADLCLKLRVSERLI